MWDFLRLLVYIGWAVLFAYSVFQLDEQHTFQMFVITTFVYLFRSK